MNNFFSKNIKYMRLKLGLTKGELAKKVNVSQSTITRWENNEMGITIDNAYMLSLFFDVPLPDLIGKNLSDDVINETSENNIINKFNRLSRNDQEFIESIIEARINK